MSTRPVPPNAIRTALVAALALAIPLLAGCGFLDREHVADGLEEWMTGFQGVKDVEVSLEGEAIPGLGSASAYVVLDETIGLEGSVDVMEHAMDFPDFKGVSGLTFALERVDFTAEVDLSLGRDDAGDRDRLALLFDVAALGVVTEFSLTYFESTTAHENWIDATATADVFDTLDELAEASNSLTINWFDITNASGDTSIVVDGLAEAEALRAIYNAISESFTILEFSYRFDELTVRVAGTPNDEVAAIAERIAPEIAFTAQFGNLTTEGDVEYLQPAIDAVNATGLATAVFASDTTLSVGVAGSASASVVDNALMGVDLYGATLVYFIDPPTESSDGFEDSFIIRSATPGETLPRFHSLFDAVEQGALRDSDLDYSYGESDMVVRGSTLELTDEQMGELAVGLRDAVPTGFEVTIAGGAQLSFTAADTLDLDDAEYDAQDEKESAFAVAFVTAWNETA